MTRTRCWNCRGVVTGRHGRGGAVNGGTATASVKTGSGFHVERVTVQGACVCGNRVPRLSDRLETAQATISPRFRAGAKRSRMDRSCSVDQSRWGLPC